MEDKMSNRAIELMKFNLENEKSKMNYYIEEIKLFTETYGNSRCDYLEYRKNMELYHRSRVSLLMDLIRELES